MAFVTDELSEDTFVDVMAQYTPYYRAKREERYEEITERRRGQFPASLPASPPVSGS